MEDVIVKKNHDIVDEALNLLRADAPGGGAQLNTEQENLLMQKYDAHTSSARSMRTRPLMIALALFAVSGVTFAATGGVERIRKWFVTVDVNGETTEIPLTENGSHAMTIQTGDGGVAKVRIDKGFTQNGDDLTKVRVEQAGDDGKQITESVVVRGRGPAEPESAYTMEDIGDAAPVARMVDADQVTHEVYIVPKVDEKGSQVFHVVAAGTPEARVIRIASPDQIWYGDDVKPEATLDDDGTLTLRIHHADGGEEVVKSRLKRKIMAAGDREPDGVQVQTPDGQVKINIDEDTGADRN